MNTATKTQQIETVEAYCDCCASQANGERSELESEGWFLGSREEFCPNCND
jgi:hypothetical protein